MSDLQVGGLAWWRPAGEKPPCFPRNYPEMTVEVHSVNPEMRTALVEYIDNPSRLTRIKKLVGMDELTPYEASRVRRDL